MTAIKINDADTCRDAADWCKRYINKWKLDFEFGKAMTTYVFKFANDKDATLFALKWVH